MEEAVNFFIRHIPNTIVNHLDECVDNLALITENLLLKERFLILVNLFHNKKFPSFFPLHKKDFIAFISQKPKIAEPISAQQMHFICKLYEFFIQNPVKLVTVTVSAFKEFDEPMISYFTHSVIPSIFGFFSCSEHLTFAYQFYTILIIQAPKAVIEQTLSVYFLASATIKYLMAVYDDVNTYFCHDIRLSEKNIHKSIIQQHARTLMQSIIYNMKLLPYTHLNLLTLLSQNGWTQDSIMTFLIKNLLIPQIRMMLNASHFSNHINAFQQVADESIVLFKEEISKNIDRNFFNNNHSILEIPKAFTDFDRTFVQFASTPRDAWTLFECAKKVIEFPPLLLKLGDNDTFNQLTYRPVFMKMYPKNLSPQTFSTNWRDVVFKSLDIETQNFQIPEFDRIWRYLEYNSSAQNCSIKDYLDQNQHLKQMLFQKKALDLTGLCKQCLRKASENHINDVCDECKEILKKNGTVDFSVYLINQEYEAEYQQSKLFEKLLKIEFAMKQLKKWIKEIDHFYDMIIMSLSQFYINEYFAMNPPKTGAILDFSPSQVLCITADVLNTPHVIALFLSTRMSILLEKWMQEEKNRKMIDNLQVKWRQYMDTHYKTIELPECFQGVGISKTKRLLINQYYMWINLGLESINLIPFNKRFMFLLTELGYILKLTELLGLDNQLILHAIKICANKDLIFTIVAFGATLGKSVDYLNALTSKEKKLWHTLETIVNKMTEGSQEIKTLFYNLYNSLFDYVQCT